MKQLLKLMSLLSLLWFNSLAFAGSTTSPVQSTAKLTSTCVLSATSINFGDITQTGATSTNKWATGNIQVLCTKNSSYSINLNGGTKPGTWRYMTGNSSAATVAYTVCQSQSFNGSFPGGPGCVTPWWQRYGQVNGTGTGALQTYNAYGVTPTGFYNPDSYVDTITATVSY